MRLVINQSVIPKRVITESFFLFQRKWLEITFSCHSGGEYDYGDRVIVQSSMGEPISIDQLVDPNYRLMPCDQPYLVKLHRVNFIQRWINRFFFTPKNNLYS